MDTMVHGTGQNMNIHCTMLPSGDYLENLTWLNIRKMKMSGIVRLWWMKAFASRSNCNSVHAQTF